MPSSREVAVRLRRVDAGVDGVRLEVEDQGRASRRARFSAAPSAAREAAPRRAAASSAATRLIRADPIPKGRDKGSRAGLGASAIPVRLRAARQAGGQFDAYEEVASSARSRSRRVYRRADRHAASWSSSSPASSCSTWPPGENAQFGSDFAVVGLTHFLVLFALIISIGVASGGHFNPAVTAAFIALRRIDPIDGARLHPRPALGRRPRRAAHQGASCSTRGAPPTTARRRSAPCSAAPSRAFLVEGIGTFVLVLDRARRRPQPGDPALGRRSRSAARSASWSWSSARSPAAPSTRLAGSARRWSATTSPTPGLYILGPIVGGLLAAAVYKFVIEPRAARRRSSRTPSRRAAPRRPPGRRRRCGRSARRRRRPAASPAANG